MRRHDGEGACGAIAEREMSDHRRCRSRRRTHDLLKETTVMKAKVAGLMLGVLGCSVVCAGYVDAETIHFHLSGPISPASPRVNAQAGTDNTPRRITHVHPGVLTVQGWPVNL